MACDLCGKTGTRLADLLSIYATNDIKCICPACEKTVNRHLFKMKDVGDNMVRRLFKMYLRERKGAATKEGDPHAD